MTKKRFTIGSIGETIDELITAPACVQECKKYDGAMLAIGASLMAVKSVIGSGRHREKLEFNAFRHLDRPFAFSLIHKDGLEFLEYRQSVPSPFSASLFPAGKRHAISIENAVLNAETGSVSSATYRYYFDRQFRRFLPSSKISIANTKIVIDVDDPINFLTFSLVKRSHWTVKVGHPGMFRFGLVTDAIGVQSFLSDRDKKTSRRAAIAHWVEHHWRQNRKDPNVENRVRAHFRGKNSCEWRDLSIEVSPPAELIERESHEKTLPIEDRTRVRPLQIC